MKASSKANFTKAGGFIAPLPDRMATEIKQRLPMLDFERISAEYGWYVIERDAAKADLQPKHISSRYRQMYEQAAALRQNLDWLNLSNIAQMLFHDEKTIEHAGLVGRIRDDLLKLELVLKRGEHLLPRGHQVNMRHELVKRLIPILEAAALEINAKPTGPLCMLVGILLEAAGETASNPVEIVKPALRGLKKTGAR